MRGTRQEQVVTQNQSLSLPTSLVSRHAECSAVLAKVQRKLSWYQTTHVKYLLCALGLTLNCWGSLSQGLNSPPKDGASFFFYERTLGSICSQGTGLEQGTYTTISVYVRETWRKCSGLISHIYLLKNWFGILTAIKNSILDLNIKAGRRLGPRFEIRFKLHEDRLALWFKFPCLVVFTEGRLSALVPVSLPLLLGRDWPWSLNL